VNQAVTLSLVATATGPAGTKVTNTATRTASSPPDLNPSNDSASVDVTPVAPTADIAVTKSVDIATPVIGDNVTFTVTAQNLGPLDATGVVVTDLLPSGLNFVSATPSTGTTYTSGTGQWNIGALALNQQVTLTLVATASGSVGTKVTNTATRTASSPPDPNPANDSASVDVTPQPPPSADIEVTMTKFPTGTVPGLTNVTFTVTAKNLGPNDATGVVVTDPPSRLGIPMAYVSYQATQGSYDPGPLVTPTGIWTIGNLAVGASAQLQLVMRMTVEEGTVTNTATRTASSPPDPNPSNDTASVSVIVDTPS
jgi:uncharacterized repeat protein (TIGR01451 family)